MSARRRPGRARARRAARGGVLAALLACATPAGALLPELSAEAIRQALETGTGSITQDDFGEEWRFRLPGGEEIVATTPFSRLVFAARQAAFKGEPLGDRRRQEELDRSRGKLQLLVTVYGRKVDFARWYQAVLRVGDRDVKASFSQNERTALRLGDGRFAARNIYVFPLEGLPPGGTVTLVVRSLADQTEILRAPLDLSRMR